MKVRVMTDEQREGWIRAATNGLLSIHKYSAGGNARSEMIVEGLVHAGPTPEAEDLVERMTTEENMCTNLATLSLMLLDAVDADDEEMRRHCSHGEPLASAAVELKNKVEGALSEREA